MSDLKTYMSLTDAESASEITSILTKNKIPFKIQDTGEDFDASFSMNKASKSILIFLHPNDFERANAVIDTELILDENTIDKEHFLYGFSNDELLDYFEQVRPNRGELLKLLGDLDFHPGSEAQKSLYKYAARQIAETGMFQRVAKKSAG